MKSILAVILLSVTTIMAAPNNTPPVLAEISATATAPAQLVSTAGWSKNMGLRSLFMYASSSNGDYVAVISSAHGRQVDLPATSTVDPKTNYVKASQNTLYILNGHTGAVLLKKDFLADDPAFSWADIAYESDLKMSFSGTTLTISGPVFTGLHPQKVQFSTEIPLPAL